MSLEIEINNTIVCVIDRVDFDVIDFNGKLFDYLESIKVDFTNAVDIINSMEHAVRGNIETVLNSGKTGRLSMIFEKEFLEQLENNTENKGE